MTELNLPSIISFFNHPAITAVIGFLSGIIAQYLLRTQISKHEIKKLKIEYKKEQLDKLKQYAEQLISQVMAYDDLASHVVVTITHRLHDKEKLDGLEQKIKRINDDLTPKLQIHFHDLADYQNDYTKAIIAFNSSFFNGLQYVGAGQRGWTDDDITRMNEELSELSVQKYRLIGETISYLKEKEESIYKE